MARNSKASNFITFVLIAALGLGAFSFLSQFTNNFTSDFKTFYVQKDGVLYTDNTDDFEILFREETKFTVGYSLDFANKKQLGYHVKVVPNVSEATKFTFQAGENEYSYEKAPDLTSAFAIEKHDNYFTLKAEKEMDEMLSSVYLNEEVTNVPQVINSDIDYFTLVIMSEDKSTEIRFDFHLSYYKIDSIALEVESYVF